MIEVKYCRHHNSVTVTGHAQSGEVGHDLVCASASILVYTLASFVENMVEAKQLSDVSGFFLVVEEGNAWIECDPPREFKPAITLVFDSICAGFELLARNYPDNISYEMKQ